VSDGHRNDTPVGRSERFCRLEPLQKRLCCGGGASCDVGSAADQGDDAETNDSLSHSKLTGPALQRSMLISPTRMKADARRWIYQTKVLDTQVSAPRVTESVTIACCGIKSHLPKGSGGPCAERSTHGPTRVRSISRLNRPIRSITSVVVAMTLA
jgi:hypothetical protein